MAKEDQDAFVKKLLEDFQEGKLEEDDEQLLQGSPTEEETNAIIDAKMTRGKVSQDVIEERRKNVWRLKQRDISPAIMSKLLGVAESTIQKDLAALKDQMDGELDNLAPNEFLADTMRVYQELELRAWQEYYSAKAGTQVRKAALDQIRSFRDARLKLLQDLGIVHKEGEGRSATYMNIDLRDWGEDAKEDIVKLLLQRELPNLQEPEVDPNFVIDGDDHE